MKLIGESLLLFWTIGFLLNNSAFAQSAGENDATENVEKQLDKDAESVTEEPVDEDVEFDENGLPKLKPHPDIDTVFKFTKPDGLVALELPSGREVQFLIGVKNNGKKNFVVETIDASLRYPTDYTYNIQNFTSHSYNRVVMPSQEITFSYSFIISDMLNERPFGFLVNLIYKDPNGKLFSNAVFNQTVDIIEITDGINMEILFVYVFLVVLVALFLFSIYHYFIAKKLGRSKKKVETGTTSDNIDYDWIPSQNLNEKKSPKTTSKSKKLKRSIRTNSASLILGCSNTFS